MDIGITSIKSQILEELFDKKTSYELPFFQREYSWTKSEWGELLDDAAKAYENKEGHFFGFMTFRKEDSEKISIIEGQQRLSTVTILIALVRDLLFTEEDTIYQSLDDAYIKVADPFSSGKAKYYKLKLAELNHDFFLEFIQQVDSPTIKIENFKIDEKRINQSNKLVFGAYKFFYDELSKKIKDKAKFEKTQYLKDLIKTILKQFVVVTTDVADEKSAYNIFQTLNNRGLDLTLTDLLKVSLLRTAGKKWEEAKNKWDEIRENLNFVNSNAFFRQYWLSTAGIVKEPDLLKEIERKIQTEQQALKFLDNLKGESENYEALLFPTKEYWASKEIVFLIEEMQILSKQSALPLLLSVVDKFKDKNEIERTLRLIINFIFRYLTIAEWENKNLERLFSDIAISIRNEEIKTSEQIRLKLKKEDIPDDQFILILATKEIKKAMVARYFFKKIEKHLDPTQEKFSDRITLEHIIPRNPDKAWKEYLKENKMEKDDWVHRMGNMTILLGKINKKIQNYHFKTKFTEYKNGTVLKINEPLKLQNSWCGNDIDKRQLELSEMANEIWKL